MKKKFRKVISMIMVAVMVIGAAAFMNPTESNAMFLRRKDPETGKWYYVKLPRKKVDMDKLCKMCNDKLAEIAEKKDDFETSPQYHKRMYEEALASPLYQAHPAWIEKRTKEYEKYLTLLDNKPAHSRALYGPYEGHYFSELIYPSLAYNVWFQDYEDEAETKLFHATYESVSDYVIGQIMVDYRTQKALYGPNGAREQNPDWYFNAWVCNAGKLDATYRTDPEGWGFDWELRCYIN